MTETRTIFSLGFYTALDYPAVPSNTSSSLPVENGTCYNYDNSIPSIVSQFVLAFLILGLNFMVVSAIVGGPKKTYRKPAFVFIAGLAVSDILLALALVAICVILVGGYQMNASFWVYLTSSTSVCFNASVNFLLVIAIDRLCFIGYNNRYRTIMRRRNVTIMVILCWAVALAPVMPLFVNEYGSCANICICQRDTKLSCPDPSCSTVLLGFKKSFLFGLFFYFLIMLISTSVIYLVLFWKVRYHSNRIRNFSSRGRVTNMKREYKLARTLGIVVTVFFFCWAPLLVLYVIDYAAGDHFRVQETVGFIIMTPTMMNSICNPIIYAARIPRMRRVLCFLCFRSEDDSSFDGSARWKGQQSWRRNVRTLSRNVDRRSWMNGRVLEKKISQEVICGEKPKLSRGSLMKSLPARRDHSLREVSSTFVAEESDKGLKQNSLHKASTWMGSAFHSLDERSKDSGMKTSPAKNGSEDLYKNNNSANCSSTPTGLKRVDSDDKVWSNLMIPNMHIDGVEIVDEVEFPNKV